MGTPINDVCEVEWPSGFDGVDIGTVNANVGILGVETGGVPGGEKEIGGGCELGLDVRKVHTCCVMNMTNHLGIA